MANRYSSAIILISTLTLCLSLVSAQLQGAAKDVSLNNNAEDKEHFALIDNNKNQPLIEAANESQNMFAKFENSTTLDYVNEKEKKENNMFYNIPEVPTLQNLNGAFANNGNGNKRNLKFLNEESF